MVKIKQLMISNGKVVNPYVILSINKKNDAIQEKTKSSKPVLKQTTLDSFLNLQSK